MANYANRTCSQCGIRKPQPEMYQQETYAEVAKSQIGVSGSTLFGAFVVGDKRSGKQLRNWLFNNNQRTYKRKKLVWMCGDCAGFGMKKDSIIGRFFKGFFYFLLLLIIFTGIIGLTN